MLRMLGPSSIFCFTAACFAGGSNVDLARGTEVDPVTITRDCRGAPEDPVQLTAMTVEGDLLRVEARFGGGCESHLFAACWDGLIQETAPPRTTLFVRHESNDDFCDAFITRDVLIDVSDLGFEIGTATVVDPDGRIELVGP